MSTQPGSPNLVAPIPKNCRERKRVRGRKRGREREREEESEGGRERT